MSVERQSSERSKQQQQNRRHVDHERDGEHSSRDSDFDQRSTCGRQLVCFIVFLLCIFYICFLIALMRSFSCRTFVKCICLLICSAHWRSSLNIYLLC